MNSNKKNPRLASALLVLLTASASQAAPLFWAPDATSPNGEFTAATANGSTISYGVLTLDDGITMVDYAVQFNSAFDLRYNTTVGTGSFAANNSFAIHADGTADLYTAINRNGHVDISILTYDLGTYSAVTNSGTSLFTSLGITAPNNSPNTVIGSDGFTGNDVLRLNNNEELFSTSPIVAINSLGLQIESLIPGHSTNLTGGPNGTDGIGALPAGFSSNGVFAWEASTGAPFPGNTLQISEADFNVTYAATSALRLRRDTDRGNNSAFGFSAAVFDSPVPEPSSALLLMAGLLAGGVRRQR